MTVTVTVDNVSDVLRSIQKLAGHDVQIGIPSSRNLRKKGPITNAELGQIHENGSPVHNIPARPSLVPGVRKALPECLKILKRGAKKAMDGNQTAAMDALNLAGTVAMNSVKALINSNIPPALAPATIASRRRSRDTKSRRDNEIAYMLSVRGMTKGKNGKLVKGTDPLEPAEAQSAEGIVALVNSAQFRNSITYVIRKIEGNHAKS